MSDNRSSTIWSPTIRFFLALVGAIAVIWFLIVAQPLIESLVVAALLAYLLDPAVHLFTRRTPLRHQTAATLVYVLFLLVVLSLPAVAGTLALGQFHRLQYDLHEAVGALELALGQPVAILGIPFDPQAAMNYLAQTAGNAVTAISRSSASILGGVTANLLWGLIILASLYYFLKDGHKIMAFLVGLAPPAERDDAKRLLAEINRVWAIFLRLQLVLFLILTLLLLLGSLLVIWLFRRGLLPLTPIGVIIVLVAFYTVVQQIDNLWLRPRLIGRKLRLHPGLVFIVLLGALALGGVLAALVAIPLMVSLKIAGSYFHRRLLGLPPWPEETVEATAAGGEPGADIVKPEENTPLAQ